MHAIIETGGKQFRVAPGDVLRVPKLTEEPGAEIALGKVLAVFQDSGDLLSGDNAGSAKVNATISAHDRGENRPSTRHRARRQRRYRHR